MKREPVSSSAIVSVGYDADAMLLDVEFESGRVYRYFEVPPSVYTVFRSAESLGGYFNAKVRDRYRFVRL